MILRFVLYLLYIKQDQNIIQIKKQQQRLLVWRLGEDNSEGIHVAVLMYNGEPFCGLAEECLHVIPHVLVHVCVAVNN